MEYVKVKKETVILCKDPFHNEVWHLKWITQDMLNALNSLGFQEMPDLARGDLPQGWDYFNFDPTQRMTLRPKQ